MSKTELKVAKWKDPVETYKEYCNAWGGFPYIWNSIWNKYIKQVEFDTWMMPENHSRLFGSVSKPEIPGWIRLIMVSTFDNYITEYDKLPIIAQYYKDFVEMFSPEGDRVCHLFEWSEDCMKIYNEYNSNNCAGICFQATSINPDPWEDYDLSKENKHKFVFERYALRLGLK